MPRRLQFILGLVTLLALAIKLPGFVASHLPDGWWPSGWAYDLWIGIVAVGFVVVVVRACRSRTVT